VPFILGGGANQLGFTGSRSGQKHWQGSPSSSVIAAEAKPLTTRRLSERSGHKVGFGAEGVGLKMTHSGRQPGNFAVLHNPPAAVLG